MSEHPAAAGVAHPPDPVVEVARATKRYPGGVEALAGVDLVVARAESVAITGPSGCGKSTLLHLVAALDVPTAGSVTVNGRDLRGVRDLSGFRRREVGLVFQLHDLLPHLSALGNVELPMFGTGRSRHQRRARARQLLDEAGLAAKERRQPSELSGGERQKVAIARALANDPSVLLADEPTGSLDSASTTRILALFQRLREEHGMTIVVVTHDREVATTADRVIEMRDGRVVGETAAGTPLPTATVSRVPL